VSLDGLPEALAVLGYDPQTAGGLLVALPAERAVTLEGELRSHDLFVARIGRVVSGNAEVVVR
jgi:hypothetical protein